MITTTDHIVVVASAIALTCTVLLLIDYINSQIFNVSIPKVTQWRHTMRHSFTRKYFERVISKAQGNDKLFCPRSNGGGWDILLFCDNPPGDTIMILSSVQIYTPSSDSSLHSNQLRFFTSYLHPHYASRTSTCGRIAHNFIPPLWVNDRSTSISDQALSIRMVSNIITNNAGGVAMWKGRPTIEALGFPAPLIKSTIKNDHLKTIEYYKSLIYAASDILDDNLLVRCTDKATFNPDHRILHHIYELSNGMNMLIDPVLAKHLYDRGFPLAPAYPEHHKAFVDKYWSKKKQRKAAA